MKKYLWMSSAAVVIGASNEYSGKVFRKWVVVWIAFCVVYPYNVEGSI